MRPCIHLDRWELLEVYKILKFFHVDTWSQQKLLFKDQLQWCQVNIHNSMGYHRIIQTQNDRIWWVGRDPLVSLSPASDPTQDTPRITTYAWEHCPKASELRLLESCHESWEGRDQYPPLHFPSRDCWRLQCFLLVSSSPVWTDHVVSVTLCKASPPDLSPYLWLSCGHFLIVYLILWCAKLHMVLKVKPYQCRAGQDNHFH